MVGRRTKEKRGRKIASLRLRSSCFSTRPDSAASIPGLNERPSHGLTRLTDAYRRPRYATRFVTISSQRTANLGNSNWTPNFRGAYVSRILRLIKRIFCGISYAEYHHSESRVFELIKYILGYFYIYIWLKIFCIIFFEGYNFEGTN